MGSFYAGKKALPHAPKANGSGTEVVTPLPRQMFFIFPKYLVWPKPALLIQKLRRKEDGQTSLEVNHNSRGKPF
jgi:hypothetical protein